MKIKRKIFVMAVAVLSSLAFTVQAQGERITVAEAYYELAKQNNMGKIERLQHRGYSIESVDKNGNNAVCLAVINENKPAYKLLVSYGAKPKPVCLNNVSKRVYQRFFGALPEQNTAKVYIPDEPYMIGAAVLGAGAVAAAFALKGSTGGGSGDSGDDNPDTPNPPTPEQPDCPANSTYNTQTKLCECWSGFGHFGDEKNCYATVVNCKHQNKDKCNECNSGFYLSDNVCYNPILNCKTQTGRICNECNSGYGTHNGDKTKCYQNIENCRIQQENKCSQCNSGYGTFGDDSKCYKKIENCDIQIQDTCRQCVSGYSTLDSPTADFCYKENPCAAYPNTFPKRDGENVECICNYNKGYTGEKENCTQTDGGNYQEGQGNMEEWNNLNELYCSSHGRYNISTSAEQPKCICFDGYTGDSCERCDEPKYKDFGGSGICYLNLDCENTRGPEYTQAQNKCICKDGYFSHNGNCSPVVDCTVIGANYTQVEPGPDPEKACACKPNFDENCENCLPGFVLDNGSCIRTEYICDEKWTGENCDVCPSQYEITVDSNGEHCGQKCALNREPIEDNPECENCAPGYEWSNLDKTCVVTECSSGVDGYIKTEDGACVCDTANGWAMSPLGRCEKKGPDYVGLKDSNINNSTITMENDGYRDEFRDVYGMKPVLAENEDGTAEYYDNVYNALASSGQKQTAEINITNKNTGANSVYGIYSPSVIYNAGAISSQKAQTEATGTIKINDTNTSSALYGIYNDTSDSIYNAFAYTNASGTLTDPSQSTANASILLNKYNTSSENGTIVNLGNITGIEGAGNIYNAYANTTGGSAANVSADGLISMTHEGSGTVIGIRGDNAQARVNNALSYLDSAVSNAVSSGKIILSGSGDVYGIHANGSVANSETQFNKSYNEVNGFHKDFRAEGLIDVTTSSDRKAAYGIYVPEGGENKVDVYNAIGYKSTGQIKATNTGGGSVFGIWNGAATYMGENEDKEIARIYNNTYNAFRSSARYGEDNVASEGKIELDISGRSTALQNAVGLYAAGDAFNAYAQSGSDVKLESLGSIVINDASLTSNIVLKGMDGEGATVANAYSVAPKNTINNNTSTVVKGNIDINVTSPKDGSIGRAYGIYNAKSVPMIATIYNAALVNNTNTVEGKINITTPKDRDTFSKMYGIYSSTYESNGGNSAEAQPKIVYNAYYGNDDKTQTKGSVLGEINITAGGKSAASDAEYYGIYLDGGTNGFKESAAYNAYSSNDAADVTGKINVDVIGGTNSGTAAGMYGKNARLYNDGTKSTITVKASQYGTNAYGMLGDSSYLYNNAVINTENKNYAAYGMSALNGDAINDVNGVINVNGKTASYGIYVKSDSDVTSAKAVNKGIINVLGEGENYGIYASGANATVENKGTITINGQTCDGNDCNGGKAIWLDNGAKLVNSGVTESSSNLDFAAMGGEVILDKGGKFIAKEKISGNLNISQNTIKDTFATKKILHDAITAENIEDLNVNSLSYLYDAKLVDNQNGSYDAEMSLKDLTTIMDKSQANYLNKNFQNKKNQELFNILTSARNAQEEQKIRTSVMGTDMLPNIAEEELKVQRSLDKTMMDELFKNKNEDMRKIVGGNLEYLGQDDRGTLTGYDLTSESMYALYDQKLDNNYRLGLGLSFTHTDTDYNNDSSRKNFMVQGYVPLTYTNNNGLTAVTMARLGYADGDYSRRGYNRTYKADTTEITYGLLNEVRYTIDLGLVNLTPFARLNAVGWYMDSANEDGDDLALELASNHVFSLESALGLYLDKEIEFSDVSKLSTILGIGWYHEFADPYRGFDATHKASRYSYRLRDKGHLNSRNRGILSAKVNYDYKDFSIYGELMQYLEDGHPLKVEGGLKYRF